MSISASVQAAISNIAFRQVAGLPSRIFALKLKTKAEGNANENRFTRAKRAKDQRNYTRAIMGREDVPPLPVVVTFTRRSVQTMDCDNLSSAMKHVRDEIAKLYGCGDSPNDPIVWKCEQVKCRKHDYGVVVSIVAASRPLSTASTAAAKGGDE